MKILCTLGPASLRPDVLAELDERHVDLFRLNLSHTPLEALQSTIAFVQERSATPVCLDTEGAQVRCGAMVPNVVLRAGRTVRLTAEEVAGTENELTLRPGSVFSGLEPDHVVGIDISGVSVRVTRVSGASAEALVLEGGPVSSNRAVTIRPAPALAPFTDKDLDAIALGTRMGVQHFALSFASDPGAVAQLRGLVPASSYVIAKIENRAGIRNIDPIMRASDAILIDRGDLSREVPIEQVPIYQKYIIRRANTANKPVFVATNLLESMVERRIPTVAEANDIMNTLLDGAHGLVLAAETAIGAHPVQCLDMVRRLLSSFDEWTSVSSARPAFAAAAN
jgi:pyruvate kinase